MLNLEGKGKGMIRPADFWTPASTSDDYWMNLSLEEGPVLDQQWKRWAPYVSEDINDLVGLSNIDHIPKEINFSSTGLAIKFSRLKTEGDIKDFANAYGLLGILPPKRFDGSEDFSSIVSSLRYGKSFFEPLAIWNWHIRNVRRLIKLYNALIKEAKGEDGDIEITILTLDVEPNTKLHNEGKYGVFWADGEKVISDFNNPEDMSFREIGEIVLVDSLTSAIANGINTYPKKIVRDDSRIGFHIQEAKVTEHLIVAIYFDLWKEVNNAAQIKFCDNPECQRTFIRDGKKRYCNDACKQQAWRIRKMGLQDHNK